MVRCDWLTGFVAFCRKGELAFIAVWKEREITGQCNTVDIRFCGKFNMGLSIVTKTEQNYLWYHFCQLARCLTVPLIGCPAIIFDG